MKHNIKQRKLNRTSSHRKALFMNLSNALIKHEQITTTLPKAKELRPFIEKIVTLGKKGDLSARRKTISILQDEKMTKKVFPTPINFVEHFFPASNFFSASKNRKLQIV